ncbi:MAG: hypothetical protein AVDCRST_MAG52-9, partial [uncultured Blastococcus sp.]
GRLLARGAARALPARPEPVHRPGRRRRARPVGGRVAPGLDRRGSARARGQRAVVGAPAPGRRAGRRGPLPRRHRRPARRRPPDRLGDGGGRRAVGVRRGRRPGAHRAPLPGPDPGHRVHPRDDRRSDRARLGPRQGHPWRRRPGRRADHRVPRLRRAAARGRDPRDDRRAAGRAGLRPAPDAAAGPVRPPGL